MAEQLMLDFDVSSTQRHRRAARRAELEEQPTLFASWAANIDVHLHSPREAIAQITGPDPERAHHWLAGVVGQLRVIKRRRVAFGTDKLDRLLAVRPPAQVTLDAATAAVARAVWAARLGLKPLKVTRQGQRLLAASPRWPAGMRIKDAPWTTIAALSHLGVPLNVMDNAQVLFARRLTEAGAKIATAGLAGSAVLIRTSRPALVENMGLAGLAYAGQPGDGVYKLPLLLAGPLLNQPLVEIPDELADAIREVTRDAKPLTKRRLGPNFPWTLFDFQAVDAGAALRILEATGGVLLAGDMGSGKGIVTTEYVLTPRGRTLVGDVEVGDLLLGRDGRPTQVRGVYPQGTRPVYRVTFTDGTAVDVDDQHLWAVHRTPPAPGDNPDQVVSTQNLVNDPRGLRDRNGNACWYIPIAEPLQFTGGHPLPIGPYELGAFLGSEDKGGDGRLAGAETFPVDALQSVGGWETFVPDVYKYAPEAARRSLLQGLLDTAGVVTTRQHAGRVEYTTASEQLADDVAWLTQSLGGTARKHRCTPGSHQGEQDAGRPGWSLSLRFPPGERPFRRADKHAQYTSQTQLWPERGIASIEPIGHAETVCFQVDAADHLFLLDAAIVSHNTTVGLALAHTMETWPLLVVAPLSAFSTWERQLGQMGRSTYLATDNPRKAWQIIEAGQHDAVVISYDRLPAFVELIERLHFRALIADEIQRIRTPSSKRSRALRTLAASMPIRIGLSGTPLTNTLADILSVGSALAPGEWRPRANSKDLDDMYPGDPVEGIAAHLGSMMVRRRIDEVGQAMPDRHDHRVYVAMTPEQRQAIADLEAEAQAAKEAGEFAGPQGKFNALVKLARMRKIIANPRSAGVGGPNPKIEHAMRLIRDFHAQGRKGVVFTVDRASFTDLGAELDQAGIRWGGIWGSTPARERIAVERRLHAGELDVVLCTIAAGAESWTASPTATYCIFLSYVWAPATLSQAEARVYRLNSDLDGPPIQILYLHATGVGGTRLGDGDDGEGARTGSVDDRMVEILEVKKQLFAQVVDRTTHVDPTVVHTKLSDLLFILTGQKDDKLLAKENDQAAAQERVLARKRHARQTLYARKGRNRNDTSLVHDDGSTALTQEQYRAARDLDSDVQGLLDDLDHIEGDDVAAELDLTDFTDEAADEFDAVA